MIYAALAVVSFVFLILYLVNSDFRDSLLNMTSSVVIEGWLKIIYPVISITLVVLFSYKVYQLLGNGRSWPGPGPTPRPSPTITPTPTPMPTTTPMPNNVLKGKVVEGPTDKAVEKAEVRVGSQVDYTKSDGSFSVVLDNNQSPEQIVLITHANYMNYFLRIDDPTLTTSGMIRIKPKMRLIVWDFEADGQALNSYRDKLRNKIQHYLINNPSMSILQPNSQNDPTFEALMAQHRAKPLYDPNTLAQFGKRLGVTDLITGKITEDNNSITFDLKIVNVETAVFLVSESYPVRKSDFEQEHIDKTSSELTEFLLSQLTNAAILSPKDGSTSGHESPPLYGYVENMPANWKMWIIVESGNAGNKYPQPHVTIDYKSGLWHVNIYIGERNERVTTPSPFKFYVMITNKEYSHIVEENLGAQATGVYKPLDISQWKSRGYRIFKPITIYRLDK